MANGLGAHEEAEHVFTSSHELPTLTDDEAAAVERSTRDRDRSLLGFFECCFCGFHSTWKHSDQANGGSPCRQCGHRCDKELSEHWETFLDQRTLDADPEADLAGCILWLYPWGGRNGLEPPQILALFAYVDRMNDRWAHTIFAQCCQCGMVTKDRKTGRPRDRTRFCTHCEHQMCDQGCHLARHSSGDTIEWDHHVTFNELKSTMPDLYFCNCPRGLRLGWQAPAHGSPKYGNVNNEWKTDCCQGSESHSRGQPFDSLHQCVRFYEGKESTQRYQDYQRLKKKISGGLRDLYKERLEARPAAVLFHRKRWAFEAVQYDGPTWPPAIMDRLPELLG